MQLAHQRMGEIGSQNLDLLQEVALLKEMLNSHKNPDGQDGAEVDLHEVPARCAELEGQIATLLASIEALKGNGNEAAHEEGRLKSNEMECAAPINPDESQSSEHGMIQQLAELNTEFQLTQASVTALKEEKRQLEMELASRMSTEGELVKRLQTNLREKDHELDSLRIRVEALQDERANTKASMGTSLGRHEISGDATAFPSITREDEFDQLRELQQLRAANVAAQEWMEKAVGHHQMLTEEVAALEIYAEQLKEQLRFSKGSEHIREGEDPASSGSKSERTRISEGAFRRSSVLEDAGDNAESMQRRLHAGNEGIVLLEGQALSRGEGVSTKELADELQALRVIRVQLDTTCKSQALKIDDLEHRILEFSEEESIKALEIAEMTAKLIAFEKLVEMSHEKELALQVEVLVSEKKQLTEQLEKLERSLAYVTNLELELEDQKRIVDSTNAMLSQAKAELKDKESASLALINQLQGTLERISLLQNDI